MNYKKKGLTGNWTRITGFKVLSANQLHHETSACREIRTPEANANDLESFPFDQTWVYMLIPTPGLEPGSAGWKPAILTI
jgi:hypothetical protein